MHKIDLKCDDDALEDLKRKAEERTDVLIASFNHNPSTVRVGSFYTKFKEALEKTHHNNCAYCETDIHNQSGDVEHYRPKGRVTNDDGSVLSRNHAGQGEVKHPGYFWQAYNWDNLLLSCSDCNRRRSHAVDGGRQQFGKVDRFEISGKRAWTPNDSLDEEKPLLIHPAHDDPEEHLELDGNCFVGKDKRGRYTIRLLGLNERGDLVRRRRDAYRNVKRAVNEIAVAFILRDEGQRTSRRMLEPAQILMKIYDGTAEFLTAQRGGMDTVLEEWKKDGGDFDLRMMVKNTLADWG